ncbi:MAG: hypothetical protein ABMA02_18860 [Saprospiraceae bacterium]
MKVREYKKQINAKWGTIKDNYTKNLIAQLIAYAEELEAKTTLAPPKKMPYGVTPKGDEIMNAEAYRNGIDRESLSNLPADADGPSPGELVDGLLTYTEQLEQQLN